MIIKKQGKVNEIVYQYTVYNDGQIGIIQLLMT